MGAVAGDETGFIAGAGSYFFVAFHIAVSQPLGQKEKACHIGRLLV
ncbi:hypothetical protein [uncultured Paenibacillus sp.]|nr:hypothetical protein [uncultured Paenibacillus sp.]